MTIRKTIFWLHLLSGIITGLVIAIMSVTGIAIAFEEEILAWADRDISTVEVPQNESIKTLSELQQIALAKRPDFPADQIRIPSAPDEAYQLFVGRDGPVYINQYTGEINETQGHAIHDFIHTLEEWHRFLGMEGDRLPIGRLVTGISNLAFLNLCLTGLYLWFPKKWSKRVLRQIIWFKSNKKSKARDFNWHNVFGFWSLPGLLILVVTAVPISFEWGHKLVFALNQEEAPKSRNFGMMAVAPPTVPTPPEGAQPLEYEELISSTQKLYPDWVSIMLPLSHSTNEEQAPEAIKLNITRPDYMPSRAWIPVEVDPYTGTILQAVEFKDRSPGLRARVWVRFIHTGAAFGFWGKLLASLVTAAALVLVYTGFALSWRRFFPEKRRT